MLSSNKFANKFYNILKGDKVSMLCHTFPHEPLRKINVTICNHQVDGPPLHVAFYLILWFASIEREYGHAWHQMFLLRPGVIMQPRTFNSHPVPQHYQPLGVIQWEFELCLIQVRLRTTHPKFDPTWVRTHDLQIMTVHSMLLRRLI